MGTECLSSTAADAASVEAYTGLRPSGNHAPNKPAPTAKGKGRKMSESRQAAEAAPRTPEVLMAEVRYGIVFGELNEVFNGRVHRFLSFLWIASAALTGGGGVVTLMNRVDPTVALPWTIGIGIVSALALAAQKAFKFNEREARFREAKRAFGVLEGKGWAMAVGTLQKEVAKLQANSPSGGWWLAPLAYNRACMELGHPEVQITVPGSSKLFAGLAT